MAIGLTKLSNQAIETSESVAAAAIEWASDTGGTVLDAGSGERFISVNLQISVDFSATATGDAIVHLRKSADDGTTEDTEGTTTAVLTIACSAGNTVTRTIPVFDFDYLDVGIENEDSSYALTWSGIYEGIKYTGLS